jgi:hypothetical protein
MYFYRNIKEVIRFLFSSFPHPSRRHRHVNKRWRTLRQASVRAW